MSGFALSRYRNAVGASPQVCIIKQGNAVSCGVIHARKKGSLSTQIILKGLQGQVTMGYRFVLGDQPRAGNKKARNSCSAALTAKLNTAKKSPRTNVAGLTFYTCVLVFGG